MAGKKKNSTDSVQFTVTVSAGDLGQLTGQLVRSSAKYKALTAAQKRGVDALISGVSVVLARIVPGLTPSQKAAVVAAYKSAVQALVGPGWLTQAQADTLKTLANAL